MHEPVIGNRTWSERWHGPDQGLIASWERGREKAQEDPELSRRACNGELVLLPWKGGVESPIKTGHKFGTLKYLAMWQGLRGDPLDVSVADEVTLTCSKSGMRVTCTPDRRKYVEP